jgi:hypothetical protein
MRLLSMAGKTATVSARKNAKVDFIGKFHTGWAANCKSFFALKICRKTLPEFELIVRTDSNTFRAKGRALEIKFSELLFWLGVQRNYCIEIETMHSPHMAVVRHGMELESNHGRSKHDSSGIAAANCVEP